MNSTLSPRVAATASESPHARSRTSGLTEAPKSFRRRARKLVKKLILKAHRAALRAGVAVLPNHYYSAVPDLNLLRKTKHIWARKSELVGVESDIDGQVRRVKEICSPFEAEYRENRTYRQATEAECGPGFGYIEAQALHGAIRHFRPEEIIEVGSGVSTSCALAATALNEKEGAPKCSITCVEPYPRTWLKHAPVQLVERPVQTLDVRDFERLGAGSLLFIDSSHTVKTGSDTNYLILEVLPRLRPGVIVHFHDIYLPYDYQRDALDSFWQWQETALLHAFLIGNRGVRVLFSLGQLHYERPDALETTFPEYRAQRGQDGLLDSSYDPLDEIPDHFPASIFLEVLGHH
jgi:hypothetical protein